MSGTYGGGKKTVAVRVNVMEFLTDCKGRLVFIPIQIDICDDSAEDIRILSEALYAYDHSFQIRAYADGESLLDDWMEHKIHFDILFLDIYMPGLNGIETAGKICAGMKDAKTIFVSSSKEYEEKTEMNQLPVSYENKVFPVAAEVKVTVENHRITRIDLVEHKNGQGSPAEVILSKVAETQTLGVTLKAIEDALNNANK